MRTAERRSVWAVAWRLIRKVVRYEIAMWHSLFRWVLRRPVVPPGGEPFGYSAKATPLIWVFIVISAIEIPIVDLILPWPTARAVFLGLGMWGVLWMFGILAMLRVHPHVVGETGLIIRSGPSVRIPLPWDAIATVTARYRSVPPGGSIQLEPGPAGLALHLGVASQTAVDIRLREPLVLPLPKGGGEPISSVHINVDDPDGFVARVQEHVARLRPTG